MYRMDLASRVSYTLLWGRGWVAAIVYRGPMATFFLWAISIHDFKLFPFDRELSDDFGLIIVGLVHATRFITASFALLFLSSIRRFQFASHPFVKCHLLQVNFPGRNLPHGITRLLPLGRINLLICIFMS